MIVVGVGEPGLCGEGSQLSHSDVDHLFDPLHRPCDLEDRGGVKRVPEAAELVRHQHAVGRTRLVFQRDEADASGGSGALADDHVARDADPLPMLGRA